MAASPQWNGNSDYATFTNRDGSPLTDTEYKEAKWEAAADAAKAVISAAEENPAYGVMLYRNNEQGNGTTFNPYISVRDVQLVKWNCETLWARAGNDAGAWEKHCVPRPGGWSGMGPTQRQVDAFYMTDGKTIDDSALYTETGFAATAHPSWTDDNVDKMQSGEVWGHRIGEHNMYANREARFYAAILYNGRPIMQISNKADRNRFSSAINADGWGRAELYSTGMSNFISDENHSTTGYLITKKVSPKSNVTGVSETYDEWRPHVFIRLAKIYLNYIEALNEYDPTNPDIKKYWDMIRDRAGLPSIFVSYPGLAGDKEAQRDLIIRERQIELCFENDRYFTTRRRLLADKTDTSHPETRRMFGEGGAMYGMNVLAGTGFADAAFFQRTKFEDRVFNEEFYLFPIPQSEIDKNPDMVQNPGW
jgi:hypothetical protein